MEKCWFVLRQTHYPAPEYTHISMAFGEAEGPVLLGHFLPGPKHVDNVINSGGISPFPRDMRIWATTAVDFTFSDEAEKAIEASAKAGVPIAAAAGLTVNAEAGVVFKRMMGNSWDIERLDTQIVQPTMAYLEQCRKSAQVAAWIEKHKTLGAWKVYMISGLMIARGAKNERSDTDETELSAGPGVDVPGIATAEVKAKHTDKREVKISGQHTNDFIWAIRLTEVSKGLFGSDISQKSVTKGAVLAPGSDSKVGDILAEEGLGGDDIRALEVVKGKDRQFLVTMDGY